MLSTSLAVALLAALLAGFTSGLTGFGFALISVPLLLFVYDPTTVVVLTFVFSISVNSAVVWDSWRDAEKRLVLTLLIPALFGLVGGAEVLRLVAPVYMQLGIGVLVVLSTLLLLKEVRLPGTGTRWGPVVAGSISGALSTSTGLAGPPIVLFLASSGLLKNAFRGSIALYLLVLSIVGFTALILRGLADGGDVLLAIILVPAAILGKLLGTALVRRISENTFQKVVLGVTLLTGALGSATALWALF